MSSKKSTVRFSNFIFLLGAMYCVISISYYVICYQIFFDSSDASLAKILEQHWYKYIAFFLICTALFILGLRLREDVKVVLSKWLLASFIALYGFELYFYFSQPLNRVGSDYIDKLRSEGIDAYQNLGLDAFVATNGLIRNEGNKILPLSGISNKTTVVIGGMVLSGATVKAYETDEHGFNNIKGMYNPDDVDIVITGTCYEEFQGMNYPSKENLGEMMRASGYKALNLAKGSDHYLSTFAILKEYAEPVRPKITLLFYHARDDLYAVKNFPELSSKTSNSPPPTLLKYLNEDSFTQNLILKQDNVDRQMLKFLKSKKISQSAKETGEGFFDEIFQSNLSNIWTLYYLRSKIKLDVSPPPIDNLSPISVDFIKILKKTKKLVSNWNGELYLVRNLSLSRFKSYSKSLNENDHRFKMVRRLATQLGIRVIDLREELLRRHPEPLSLFNPGLQRYPNGEFYRLAAEIISKRLQKDETMKHVATAG
jgi:hypothetical protein